MIRNGYYQLYTRNWDHKKNEHNRLIGRFMVDRGNIIHLENHSRTLNSLFPEGPITNRILDRFQSVSSSGYYDLIHEDDIDSGHHKHLIRALELGETKPEQTFMLTGTGVPPQVLEVWAEVVTLAGRTLPESELREIMDKVKQGLLVLGPVEN